MDSKAVELDNTRELLEEAEHARGDLRNSLNESNQKMKTSIEKSKKMEQLVISENKELNSQNLTLTNR